MPFDEVMHKFKHGKLHSGSKSGKKVSSRAQAVAIMLSEKRKASKGYEEYKPKNKKIDTAPSQKIRTKMGVR